VLHLVGVVTTPAATPVSGLVVHARVFESACLPTDSGRVDVTGSFGPTDAQGRFAFEVRTLQAITDGCARLVATRGATEVGVPPTTLGVTERAGVRIRATVGGRPADTLRVTLVIP
jgi:hypothetical protein